jgi:hypothetical protein
MAAPTLISALVHSSALVTTGVYLMISFSAVFDASLNGLLLLVSGLTVFMAAVGANFEYDLRRIIALSTFSQLGVDSGDYFFWVFWFDFFSYINSHPYKKRKMTVLYI